MKTQDRRARWLGPALVGALAQAALLGALPAAAQSGGAQSEGDLKLHELLGLGTGGQSSPPSDGEAGGEGDRGAGGDVAEGGVAQPGDDRDELRRLLGLGEEDPAPATRPPQAADGAPIGEDENPFEVLEQLIDMPLLKGPPETAPAGERPVKRADIVALERRIVTLPGAELSETPGGVGPPLPAFSIFYVYDEREVGGRPWLEIGRSAVGGPQGWIAAEHAEDWKTMLVMEYAPKGGRAPVLFFRQKQELVRFVRDPHVAQEAAHAYGAIREGTLGGDYIIAIEPDIAVDPDRPYLMPILDSQTDLFDSLDPVTLVEVAGLTLDAGGSEAAAPAPMRAFRYGVVFAIDTTSSMGRYIGETRDVVRTVIDAFDEAGLSETVDFGLVGFRDHLGADAGIGYVSRTYQPLDAGASVASVLANFDLMEPTGASTEGFDEDAFAGLHEALNGMGWSGYDFRMVVLITDAGPRRGSDPKAARPGYDVINVRENAARQNVALAAIHLLTPEARRAGNVGGAAEIYTALTTTGDETVAKYFAVETEDPQGFRGQITSFARGLVSSVAASAKGERIERRTDVASLGDAVVNEVFRAQLDFLGDTGGQGAPAFARAWAADRDLTDPATRGLNVKVFLTRQQLSGLAEGAEAILAAYEEQRAGGGDFFRLMRAFSAQNAVEGAGSRPISEAGRLLPAFLEALPYRSDFLALDPQMWSAGGPTFQRELAETLRSKLRAYRDIAGSATGWVDLGAGRRDEDVYAVSLDLLP